jgi:type I restriction enzyme S subunit
LIIPENPQEQQAIASILSSFDEKIELLREQNKTLETMAQTIFKEWFGKYSVDDELPEGWRVGKLSSIIEHMKKSVSPSKYSDDFFCHYSLPSFDS